MSVNLVAEGRGGEAGGGEVGGGEDGIGRQQAEVARGERFAFGRNWTDYLRTLDESRVRQAEQSLQRMLGRDDLRGLTFLDVGSGSGLYSLAAVRLGAARVHSFDYDPQCVACGRSLRQREDARRADWTIESGDVLSTDYLDRLGQFDIVYSWGVLHQTGDMWQALENIAGLPRPGGQLYISLYNYQPWLTPFWSAVKRTYNAAPGSLGRLLVHGYLGIKTPLLALRRRVLAPADARCQPPRALRGMNAYHDAVDWIGGYPFETATPDAVFRFFHERGYWLSGLSTVGGGSGCNEFVFHKRDEDAHPARD